METNGSYWEKEFCVNFINANYLDQCWKTIHEHDFEQDEITSAGFTREESRSIAAPRIAESFLKLECEYEWEKELCPDSHNITICGSVKHVSVKEKFANALTKDRYGKDTFMFNLHNPMNPFTGEYFGGGVGVIEHICEM